MRKADTPMRKYSIVHTGANTQLGGEKGGLMRNLYHVEIAEMVNGVLSIPTSSQPTTETRSFGKSFTILVYTFFVDGIIKSCSLVK